MIYGIDLVSQSFEICSSRGKLSLWTTLFQEFSISSSSLFSNTMSFTLETSRWWWLTPLAKFSLLFLPICSTWLYDSLPVSNRSSSIYLVEVLILGWIPKWVEDYYSAASWLLISSLYSFSSSFSIIFYSVSFWVYNSWLCLLALALALFLRYSK